MTLWLKPWSTGSRTRRCTAGLLIVGLLASLISGCSAPPMQSHSPAPVAKPLEDAHALSLYGQSSTFGAIDTSGEFPLPAGLEPKVDFWRNVYARWSRQQVALHDNRYLNVIYAVLTLPGDPLSASYTDEQHTFVRTRREALQAQLQDIEQRMQLQQPLTAPQQALVTYITTVAGPEALHGAADRVRSQRGVREKFKRGLEISGRYDATFKAIFRQAGLPEDLAYLPHVESSFQYQARSSVGAGGVWQFMPATAKNFMAVNAALDERFDPVASAYGAARYLSNAYQQLGSWPLAVTAYNHGVGGMKRAKSQYGTRFMDIVNLYDGPAFGFASRNFYAEFLAARDIARHPHRYFPEGIRYEPLLIRDRTVLPRAMVASRIARHYAVERSQLIQLNPAWTAAARQDKVALPSGTTVWLPSGTLQRLAQQSPKQQQ